MRSRRYAQKASRLEVCFNSESDGCDGGMIDTPWSYIKSTGAVSGGQYQGTGPFGKGLCSDFSLPHCHHHGPQGKDPYPAEGKPGCPSESSPEGPTKCDATAKAPHDDFQKDKYSYQGKTQTASGEKAIQQMIMKGGPVETAFTVYSDFEMYTKGIYKHVSGEAAGGHAVRMVGWGVDNGVKYWKIANSWNPYLALVKELVNVFKCSSLAGSDTQNIKEQVSCLKSHKWGICRYNCQNIPFSSMTNMNHKQRFFFFERCFEYPGTGERRAFSALFAAPMREASKIRSLDPPLMPLGPMARLKLKSWSEWWETGGVWWLAKLPSGMWGFDAHIKFCTDRALKAKRASEAWRLCCIAFMLSSCTGSCQYP